MVMQGVNDNVALKIREKVWQHWSWFRVKKTFVGMVRLTLLARISDGLPLAEGLEDAQQELENWKRQAKV